MILRLNQDWILTKTKRSSQLWRSLQTVVQPSASCRCNRRGRLLQQAAKMGCRSDWLADQEGEQSQEQLSHTRSKDISNLINLTHPSRWQTLSTDFSRETRSTRTLHVKGPSPKSLRLVTQIEDGTQLLLSPTTIVTHFLEWYLKLVLKHSASCSPTSLKCPRGSSSSKTKDAGKENDTILQDLTWEW